MSNTTAPIRSIFDIFPGSQRINNSPVSTSSNGCVTIEHPAPFDILCGQDKTYAMHPGNQLFRELIARSAVDYSTATTKHDKMKITKNIVATMELEHGSRFLRVAKRQDRVTRPTAVMVVWEILPQALARDKTSHALRFYCNHNKIILQGGSSNNSSTNNSRSPSPSSSVPPVYTRRVSNDTVADGSDEPTPIDSTGAAAPLTTTGADHILERQQLFLQQSMTRMTTMTRTTSSGSTNMSCGSNATTRFSAMMVDMDDNDTDLDDWFQHNTNNSSSSTNKETFDTLRSADLHAILNEPLEENEWDTLMTLAV